MTGKSEMDDTEIDESTRGQPTETVVAGEVVVLSIPASARWIRLARLAVTGIAHVAALEEDRVEDVRMAIDEACGILVERRPVGPLEISMLVGTDAGSGTSTIVVDVSCATTADNVAPAGFAAEVLDSVTNSWLWREDAGKLKLTFVVNELDD